LTRPPELGLPIWSHSWRPPSGPSSQSTRSQHGTRQPTKAWPDDDPLQLLHGEAADVCRWISSNPGTGPSCANWISNSNSSRVPGSSHTEHGAPTPASPHGRHTERRRRAVLITRGRIEPDATGRDASYVNPTSPWKAASIYHMRSAHAPRQELTMMQGRRTAT